MFKPPLKLGGLLRLFKDAIKPRYRQGAIYKINCSDCDQCSIGDTKRWLKRAKRNMLVETRKKEHMRDVKISDNNTTALFKHAVELGHSIDWKNYEIFQIETDYHKRKFIESFYINSLSNVNDKKSVCFLSIYIPKFVFVIPSFRFSRSSTILTALVLLIVSRNLVLLRCLFFRLLTHSLTEGR